MNNPLTSLAAALLVATCPATAGVEAPVAIAPGPGAALALTLSATGVQIYECRNEGTSVRANWTFVGPEALLFDGAGREVAHHGAGPFW